MWEWLWRWDTLWYAMVILYLPCCILLIGVVLLQKGKGTGFAGAFGIGPGSDTVFGPRMSRSLPVRLTYGMAAGFMLLALCMSLISGRVGRGIAPEKIDDGGSTPITGTVDQVIDGMEDLGAAAKASDQAAPSEPAAPGEAQAAPGTVTLAVPPAEGAPPGEQAPTPQPAEAPGTITLNVTPPPEGTAPAAAPAPEQPAAPAAAPAPEQPAPPAPAPAPAPEPAAPANPS